MVLRGEQYKPPIGPIQSDRDLTLAKVQRRQENLCARKTTLSWFAKAAPNMAHHFNNMRFSLASLRLCVFASLRE
jgi:hypothetical protein